MTSLRQQVRGKPVLVKHRDIPGVFERDFNIEHMYKTLAQTVSSKEITGIQKIRGLWQWRSQGGRWGGGGGGGKHIVLPPPPNNFANLKNS